MPSAARIRASEGLTVHHLPVAEHDDLAELIRGLSAAQPWISPRFFYDRRGSELFDAITMTSEYYPTRTEAMIFQAHLPEMLEASRCALLLEPGSGNCGKAERFFRQGDVDHYVPIEISADFLIDACQGLQQRHPQLQIDAVCTDFTRCETLPAAIPQAGRMLFFPGSTIGNFEPLDAVALLKRFRTMVGAGGYALIGVDLKKEAAILNAAYNDAEGLTAAFNRNALHHLNARFDCGFEPEAFAHHAFYNEAAGRVEMHLRCRQPTEARVNGCRFEFRPSETIHSENSWKYTPAEFRGLAEKAGFAPVELWTDEREWFSLHLLRAGEGYDAS